MRRVETRVYDEEESKRTIGALEKQLEEVKRSQEESDASTLVMEEARKEMTDELDAARKRIKDVEAKAGSKVKKLQRELKETKKRMEESARGGNAGGGGGLSGKKVSALENKLKKLHL